MRKTKIKSLQIVSCLPGLHSYIWLVLKRVAVPLPGSAKFFFSIFVKNLEGHVEMDYFIPFIFLAG
jgi:hypothetical protein